MLVMSVVLGAVLRLLDMASGLDRRSVFAGATGVLAFTLANSALSTTLLTHGLMFLMVLALLWPAEPDRLARGPDSSATWERSVT
jgi:hypothetical protein